MQHFDIRQPDDWHLHLRDGDLLKAVLPHTTRHFARAIIMPNLVPPIVKTHQAQSYRTRIVEAVPTSDHFTPLMTLYLTEQTEADDVAKGAALGLIKALKLYPAGATTNSESGVRNIERVYDVLERMSVLDIPLLVHGEVTDPEIDIFDREAVFIDQVLDPIRQKFPRLRVVMEHITTEQGAQYVRGANDNLAATITTHHLIVNRNHLLAGGIRPHYYCLPVAKREKHRLALVQAATSGDKRFFLGTDSAPHTVSAKQSACGCAGIFSTPNTLSCLAHIFEDADSLHMLERFTSLNGPSFYKLAPNERRMKFVKRDVALSWPDHIAVNDEKIVIFDPGFDVFWDCEIMDKTGH